MGGPPIRPPISRGVISLTLWGARDDLTDEDSIGYRIYTIAGVLPEGFVNADSTIFAEPLELSEYRIALFWNDGGTDYQEAFNFTLAVTAIDLAGNESDLSNFVIVGDKGGYQAPHPRR